MTSRPRRCLYKRRAGLSTCQRSACLRDVLTIVKRTRISQRTRAARGEGKEIGIQALDDSDMVKPNQIFLIRKHRWRRRDLHDMHESSGQNDRIDCANDQPGNLPTRLLAVIGPAWSCCSATEMRLLCDRACGSNFCCPALHTSISAPRLKSWSLHNTTKHRRDPLNLANVLIPHQELTSSTRP